MSEQKPSQMLRKAWALIDAPEKWTQSAFARDYNGTQVTILNEDATCFCSLGALIKSNDGFDEAAKEYLNRPTGGIVNYNDTHTWPEVKAAWMKAIALAAEDEAKNETNR